MLEARHWAGAADSSMKAIHASDASQAQPMEASAALGKCRSPLPGATLAGIKTSPGKEELRAKVTLPPLAARAVLTHLAPAPAI
jgi:hypothetical protein